MIQCSRGAALRWARNRSLPLSWTFITPDEGSTHLLLDVGWNSLEAEIDVADKEGEGEGKKTCKTSRDEVVGLSHGGDEAAPVLDNHKWQNFSTMSAYEGRSTCNDTTFMFTMSLHSIASATHRM